MHPPNSRETMHVAVSLDYMKNAPDRELACMLKNPETGRSLTGPEVRTLAVIMKAKGFTFLPTCDNHDARGMCRGHPEKS